MTLQSRGPSEPRAPPGGDGKRLPETWTEGEADPGGKLLMGIKDLSSPSLSPTCTGARRHGVDLCEPKKGPGILSPLSFFRLHHPRRRAGVESRL